MVSSTTLEMDSPAGQGTDVELSVSQTHSPVSLNNYKVLDIGSYTKQHSKGLLTPCRQVGLSRRSPRNSVSPSTFDLNRTSTPSSSRFVPAVHNSKGVGKFSTNVLDNHTHEDKTSAVLGKRKNWRNTTENVKQCKYEMEKELIHDKRGEGTKEKKRIENFRNKCRQSNINAISPEPSDTQSNVHEHTMNPENDGLSTEKNTMGNLADARHCRVDATSCKDLDLQSFSLSDKNSVITYKGTNDGRIKTDQIKNLDNITQQFHVHTHFHRDLNFQSRANNEAIITNSTNMTEYTEHDYNILKQQIRVQESEVKRLKLILLYKKKHDVNELATEIARWKEGCQEALRRLHKFSVLQGHQINMIQVLKMFGIPPEVVGYNEDTEDFD